MTIYPAKNVPGFVYTLVVADEVMKILSFETHEEAIEALYTDMVSFMIERHIIPNLISFEPSKFKGILNGTDPDGYLDIFGGLYVESSGRQEYYPDTHIYKDHFKIVDETTFILGEIMD
jgi:hypothetical protein